LQIRAVVRILLITEEVENVYHFLKGDMLYWQQFDFGAYSKIEWFVASEIFHPSKNFHKNSSTTSSITSRSHTIKIEELLTESLPLWYVWGQL